MPDSIGSRFFQPKFSKRPRAFDENNFLREKKKTTSENDIIIIDSDDDENCENGNLEVCSKNNLSHEKLEILEPVAKSSSSEDPIPPAEKVTQAFDGAAIRNEPSETSKQRAVQNFITGGDEIKESHDLANVDCAAGEQEPKPNVNPFAKFAFGTTTTTIIRDPTRFNSITQSKIVKKCEQGKKKPSKTKKSEECSWIPMKQVSPEKQEEIVIKWHSLLDPLTTDMEDRRFQMLVAARLHARCHETGVRKAMIKLCENINPLTVHTIAATDPEEICACIKNLQYHSTKSKHIVQAAKEIQTQFKGKVPELERELKLLTGIGPVFADLLSFVNTREKHQEMMEKKDNGFKKVDP